MGPRAGLLKSAVVWSDIIDVCVSPGSRSWDQSHSRNLLAQALRSPRFGNGAKKKFAIEVTNPGRDRGRKELRKKPRQNEDDV